METAFLDSNILVSAALVPDAGMLRLWKVAEIELVTSVYAIGEARRNLDSGQRERLERILENTYVPSGIVSDQPKVRSLGLPSKDEPIMSAAIHFGADYLITGDKGHFGHLFGGKILGVTVLPPAQFLKHFETR